MSLLSDTVTSAKHGKKIHFSAYLLEETNSSNYVYRISGDGFWKLVLKSGTKSNALV